MLSSLALTASPQPWVTAVPFGLVSSPQIYMCPSNVFPTADLIMLLLLKNFQGLPLALRTKTFAWPLTHLPLCFMHTGGLTRLDIFFFLLRAFVHLSGLLEHSHLALHLNPLTQISLALRGLPQFPGLGQVIPLHLHSCAFSSRHL